MKKRLTAALLALVMVLGAMPNAGALLDGFSRIRTYHNQFSDVPTSAWYYNTVKSSYELGIFNGTSDTKFSPDKELTLIEIIALMARIHAAYYGNEIKETAYDDAWYSKYGEYVSRNITNETNTDNFSYAVSRAEFVHLMSMTLPSSEFGRINDISDGQIPDINNCDSKTRSEIYMFYRAGILSGNDAYGTFSPNSNITRVQVAAIISRMIDPSQRQHFTLKEQRASLNNWLGNWKSDTYRIGFTFEEYNGALYFSAVRVWGQNASRLDLIEDVALSVNSDGTYAVGYYTDSRTNHGIVMLQLDGDDLYATITCDGTPNSYNMVISHDHFSRV